MKRILTILSALFISTGLLAQDQTAFQKAMSNSLNLMSEAKSSEDYQNLVNRFERIADKETTRWEPVYYMAFTKTLQAFSSQEKETVGEELRILTERLQESLGLESVSANELVQSEIHALIAMMYSARMSANPMILGPQLAPLNAEHLGKATGLNSNNPRAFLLKAQNLYYTPEAFGGDKVKAKLLAEKSIKLFKAEQGAKSSGGTSNPFMPSWGKEQAEGLIKSIEKKN